MRGSIKAGRATDTISFKLIDPNRSNRPPTRKATLEDGDPAKTLAVIYNEAELPAKLDAGKTVMIEGVYTERAFLADDVFNWFFSMSTKGTN